jgi:hypothetical protein
VKQEKKRSYQVVSLRGKIIVMDRSWIRSEMEHFALVEPELESGSGFGPGAEIKRDDEVEKVKIL